MSWLDQLGSWWDKNSTTIITGVMALAIGTVAVMTVVATGGLAAPALAAAFAGALGTTYGALAASFVVSGIAAAGVTAATTGVVSLASTVPGLNQALSPTVNSTSFQMLQSGSMIIAGTGAAFLAQFAPTSNNKTQTQKEEAQAEAKVGEQTSTAGNTAGESESKIETPYGDALQDYSDESINVRKYVEGGGELYRGGTLGRSRTTDAQFWATESPCTPGYADKYGVDFDGLDYVIGGSLQEGQPFITRPAPGLGINGGGAIEVVTKPGTVKIDYFYMP